MAPGVGPVADRGGEGDHPLFELPDELAIDTETARQVLVGFIRTQLGQRGFSRALLGLSGGIDSALVAFLAAEAVGRENLLGLMMPYRTSSSESVVHAKLVVERLGCASDLIDISPIVDGYFGREGEAGAGGSAAREASPIRRGNFMARARMSVLYDRSVPWGGLVMGTGNKTEALIGYATVFGDAACAFAPIGDLYKSQVRQMALAVGVPEEIIRKAPSADLWPGQTDETEAGFSYPELDRLLFWMIDGRCTDEQLVAMGFGQPTIDRVKGMVAGSEFKRQVPPIAKMGPGTTGAGHLHARRPPGSPRR